MKISLKKIITLITISGFFVNPIYVIASYVAPYQQTTPYYNPQGVPGYLQTQPNTSPTYGAYPYQTGAQYNPYQAAGNPYLNPTYVNSRIATGMSSTASTTSMASTTSSVGGAAGSLAGCGAGQILSSMVTGSITKAFGSVVQDATTQVVSTVTNVPVAEGGVVANDIKTITTNTQQQTSAQTGTPLPGKIGIMGLSAPSWDAVAYCIVNAMIIYVADSTIQWINTGFNGNPAFLNNPDLFFKQLADEEAGAFVQNLAYGVTGQNVCDVLRAAMVSSILNQYSQQYPYMMGGYNRGLSNGFLGCAFDQNPAMFNTFVNGNFAQGGGWNSWYQMTQNPYANPYDSYFRTNDTMGTNITTAQASQSQQLGWNGGFLSYKKCTDPKDPKTCTVVTPGGVIQTQLNETLNLGKNRLVLATKFDQVLTALINQLIVTALGTATQSMSGGY